MEPSAKRKRPAADAANGDSSQKQPKTVKPEASEQFNGTKAATIALQRFTAPKSCVHEVALPPGFISDKDSRVYGTIHEPKYEGPRAKTYPFTLDPFQETSVACLERRESVLVSAHTSAGKTAVAEYAIAMAFKEKGKVIYTSPLKALSNQKYRELSGEFSDVGLMTGDVTIAPNAACLVMTTEILRHMLYHGSETLRDVAWVVFDEIHYMRDRERGVVWEESIIFLPPAVKMVFLSATITNALEFAEWVCHLHKQPCHVVYTDYRPTPLQHYAFPQGGTGLYLVVDEKGRFREDNFNKLTESLGRQKADKEGGGEAMGNGNGKWPQGAGGRGRGRGGGGPNGGRGGGRGGRGNGGGQKEQSDMHKIVKMIMDRKMQPVIVFSFSRRECEAHAMAMSKLDFNSEEEKAGVEEVFKNAVALLSEEDQSLPAIEYILPLLQRGIGVHHSGLLPILKEVIEILFQEGLIKALFATETFAMGLNMPAKTVVFTSLRKWDGEQHRWMGSGEYIQMSGRAGRRGKDDRGICIMMIDEQMDMATCKELIMGKPAPLESSFRLTYYALLNLMSRAEGQFNTEYVIANSFHQFLHEKQMPDVQRKIAALEADMASMDKASQDSLTEYHRLRLRLAELEKAMMMEILRPDRCLPFLRPGRLVKVREGPNDWGWGVLVRVTKRPAPTNPIPSAVLSVPPAALYVIDVLLHCAPAANEEEGAKARLKPCPPGTKGEMYVVPVQLPLVCALSTLRVALPQDLRAPEARQSVLLSVMELQKRFPDGLPRLDPLQDMQIEAEEFLGIIREIDAEEDKLVKHPLFKKVEQSQEDYSVFKKKAEIAERIQDLHKELKDSQLSKFKQELHNRSRVLQRLGHINKEGVVQLKGRAACLVNTADELLITELMFDGAFNDLNEHQVVGLASCFLPAEKSSENVKLARELTWPLRQLQETARRLAEVQKEEKLQIDTEEYVESFKPTLMDVMYSWSKGSSFAEVCDLTDIFEGTIVRSANRLNELLCEISTAAKTVGDENLHKKFEAASMSIKRGIMFANSLYLDES